jgi:hypothetical protein
MMGGVWLSGLFNSAFMLGSFVLSNAALRWLMRSRSFAIHSAQG